MTLSACGGSGPARLFAVEALVVSVSGDTESHSMARSALHARSSSPGRATSQRRAVRKAVPFLIRPVPRYHRGAKAGVRWHARVWHSARFQRVLANRVRLLKLVALHMRAGISMRAEACLVAVAHTPSEASSRLYPSSSAALCSSANMAALRLPSDGVTSRAHSCRRARAIGTQQDAGALAAPSTHFSRPRGTRRQSARIGLTRHRELLAHCLQVLRVGRAGGAHLHTCLAQERRAPLGTARRVQQARRRRRRQRVLTAACICKQCTCRLRA